MIRRLVNHFRKKLFIKEFKYFARSSGIGSDGFAKKCNIIGEKNITIDENTWIGDGSEIIALDSHFGQQLYPNLMVGKNVRVTSRLRVTCADTIRICDDVLMAPDVFITDHNHGDDPTIEGGYSPQPLKTAPVCIEQGVWLGQRACVLPGVTIGAHSIIGANSVVSKSIPAYSIAVGAPAKVIKKWDFENKEWKRIP